MATGLLNQYTAATSDSTFINKIELAVSLAAQQIAAEADATDNHANRVLLSKAVSQPGAISAYGQAFAYLVAAQGVDNASSDAAIQSAVNAAWDTVAGAT
jgi:hypothetical protein